MIVKGLNGQVELTDDAIVLVHSGLNAKVSGLAIDQPRSIPLAALSDVVMKPGNIAANGHIIFGVGGAVAELRGQRLTDPNTIVFRFTSNAEFARLAENLAAAIEAGRAAGIDPSTVEFDEAGETRLDRVRDRSARMRDKAASTKEARMDVLAAEKAAREETRAEDKAAKEAKRASDEAAYGREVTRGAFGGKQVRIYDKGYVRIAALMISEAKYEKLLGISYSRTVQDKSSGGRAAAALATGGLNLLASGEKRDTFLMVTTDKRAYSLKDHGRSSEQNGLTLEAAGRAVLDMQQPPSQGISAVIAQPQQDIPGQLVKLKELHDGGILTDAEFAAKKQDLLDRM